MSLADQVAKRFRAALIGQVIRVIAAAILTVALARLMETDAYGLLFLTISTLSIIQIFSKLGIARSGATFITEYKETDSGQIPHILKFTFLLNLGLIGAVSVVLLLTHEFIAKLIGEPDLGPLLLVGILFIVSGTLMKYTKLTLQGFENIEGFAVVSAVSKVLILVFAVGFVLLGFSAIGGLAGYILAYAITTTGGLGYIYWKYYDGAERTKRESNLRSRLARYSIPLTVTSTAGLLDKRFDTVLVGFFLGPVPVAFYTIAKQVSTFASAPVRALGTTLSPTYEAQRAKGNTDTAARMYEEAMSNTLLIYIPACVGLMLVAEPMVDIIFGERYSGAIPVIQVMSVYIVFTAVSVLTSSGLDFLGRARIRSILRTVTTVLNIVLNIILIPLMGVVGAAIATVVTFGLYTLGSVIVMHNELSFKFRKLVTHLLKIVIIAGLMAAAVFYLSEIITGLLTFLLVVFVGGVVWLGLAIGFGLLNPNDVRRAVGW